MNSSYGFNDEDNDVILGRLREVSVHVTQMLQNRGLFLEKYRAIERLCLAIWLFFIMLTLCMSTYKFVIT